MDKEHRARKYSKNKKPNRHCGQQIGSKQRHNGINQYRKMDSILHKQKSQKRRAHFKNIVDATTHTHEEYGLYDDCPDLGYDEPICPGWTMVPSLLPRPSKPNTNVYGLGTVPRTVLPAWVGIKKTPNGGQTKPACVMIAKENDGKPKATTIELRVLIQGSNH